MRNFERYLRSNILALLISVAGVFWVSATIAAEPTESVVTIYAYPSKFSNQGTGFVFTKDGHIATAYHVVKDATRVEVFDKKFRMMTDVLVEWIDSKKDIAILKVGGANTIPFLSISKSLPVPNEEVRIVGSPRGLPKQTLRGSITSESFVSSLSLRSEKGKQLFANDIDVLPIDVTLYSGLSGAPVLTNKGFVVGILSGSWDEGRGIGWAIPGKYIEALASTVPIHKPPEEMLWERLSLMMPSWASLLRSYPKQLTSKRIAELEILEGAFQVLKKGIWDSQTKVSSIMYDDLSIGRCEQELSRRIRLHNIKIDEDAARIFAQLSLSIVREAKFSDNPQPYDDVLPSQPSFRQGLCNNTIFKDKLMSKGESQMEGDIALVTKNLDNSKFDTFYKVTDCKGTLCRAENFGIHNMGSFELISDSKVRWQNAILERD